MTMMKIDDETAATIAALARRSHLGELPFGEFVQRLIALDVEAYRADYRLGTTSFYLTGGATLVVPLSASDEVIPTEFRAEDVQAAIRGAQAGEVRYPEFVRRTMRAGCIGYQVWIAGRRVDYHGRRGETHVEPFPGQAGPSTPARPAVAVVQQVYAAFARGDLAAALDLFAPEVEIEQSREVPWGGHYGGHDGARVFFAALTSRLDSKLALAGFVDAGEEIVATGRTQGRVRATGARYDVPIAHVWTVRDGRVVRVRFCIDHPTMLSALS